MLYGGGDGDILKARLEFARGERHPRQREGFEQRGPEGEKDMLFVQRGRPLREAVLDDKDISFVKLNSRDFHSSLTMSACISKT